MRAGGQEPGKRLAAVVVVLACVLVAVACFSCTPRSERAGGEANTFPHSFFDASATTTAAPVTGVSETRGAASAGALDFTVINFTRLNLHAIHVSPHDSIGWEENVLGQDQLLDGAFVKIRFSPEEQAVRWDFRVEDENGNNAEWKNLDLREISMITLRFNNGVVSAEVE